MHMRKMIKLLAITLLTFSVMSSYGQKKHTSAKASKGSPIKIVKIEQKFEETPIVKSTAPQYGNRKSWMVISVEYKTARQTLPGQRRSFKWMDDFSVEFEVLVKNSVYKGKKVTAVLAGVVEYWSVALDGESHFAQAFINPKALRRYLDPEVSPKGKTAKQIPGRVSFYSKSRKLLARGYFVPRTSSAGQVESMFKKAEDALGVLRVKDIIFPRSKTPWFVLNFDRYEVIKDSKK